MIVVAALLAGAWLPASAKVVASRIYVDKSDRLLHVYSGKKRVASFRMALGSSPVGHKQQEGDMRTPEGHYRLDYKNANSAYFKSIHISYPNAADRASARKRGVRPGGDVMIHGEPNHPAGKAALKLAPYRDWTYGCIALSNADMQSLWAMVSVPVPIEIVP